MASVALSRRVEKVVCYPPLRDMGADQRRELRTVWTINWAPRPRRARPDALAISSRSGATS
jgi:hypothetical protein